MHVDGQLIAARRNANFRRGLALAAIATGAALAGCAAPGGLFGPEDSLPRVRSAPGGQQQAMASVLPGVSNRADVQAVLGTATVVRFDSGYEVWAYRLVEEGALIAPESPAEFVVLFGPAGVVTRTRVRPSSATIAR